MEQTILLSVILIAVVYVGIRLIKIADSISQLKILNINKAVVQLQKIAVTLGLDYFIAIKASPEDLYRFISERIKMNCFDACFKA